MEEVDRDGWKASLPRRESTSRLEKVLLLTSREIEHRTIIHQKIQLVTSSIAFSHDTRGSSGSMAPRLEPLKNYY